MKFKIWFETQEDRQNRWQRRKSTKDGKTSKQGYVSGQPRYGKGKGFFQTGANPANHRNVQKRAGDEEISDQ